MLLSTFYILPFPTLMAARTGYITTYQSYVENYNHNLIEWSQLEQIVYIFNDANILASDSGPLVATIDDRELVEAIEACTSIRLPPSIYPFLELILNR